MLASAKRPVSRRFVPVLLWILAALPSAVARIRVPTTVAVGLLVVATVGLPPAAPVGPAAAAGPVRPEPTPQQVVERMRAAVREVKDARARIEAESIDARGRRTRSVVAVWMVRTPGLVRLEVLEPAVLADQVYVIDFERLRLLVYLPVTHQVVVQTFDQAFGDKARAAQFSPDQLLSALPGPDKADLQLAGTETRGNRLYYLLEGAAPPPSAPVRQEPGGALSLPVFSPPQAARVRLWVDSSTWLVDRLVAYDASGRTVGSLAFRDLQVNSGLRPADLRHLPEDAEVVEG